MPDRLCWSESTYWKTYQVRKAENTSRLMRLRGIPEGLPVYAEIEHIRDIAYAQIGFKIPKPFAWILRLFGLSPGVIKLGYDAEAGFLVEAREKPGALPIYHYIDDETAIKIMKGELTHELEAKLMKAEEYYGE